MTPQTTTRTPKRYFGIEVKSAGSVLYTGRYWPGVGLSIAVDDGPERDQIDAGARFLAGDSAAVSVRLICGLEVHRTRR